MDEIIKVTKKEMKRRLMLADHEGFRDEVDTDGEDWYILDYIANHPNFLLKDGND